MEPQIPTSNTTPEVGGFSGMPRGPEVPQFPRPEAQPQRRVEYGERQETRERVTDAGAGDAVAPAAPQAALPQTPLAPTLSGMPTQDAVDDTPLVAADEDLIEMEWVNKAKKIVNETKSDPYLQEREISRLQASYLQKRYGKEVKIPKDE